MMNNPRSGKARSLISVMLVMLVIALITAACGSGGGEGGNGSGGSGKKKIGLSIPASNSSLVAWAEAIKAKAGALSMEVVSQDAQLNPSKQVTDMDNLLTQNVDAIIVWPLDPAVLKPAIDRANEKKVPVIGIDFNVEPGGPDYGLAHQVILGRGDGAVQVAEMFSKLLPEGSEVAGIGLAVPVPGNIFIMEKYRTELDKYSNVTWVGQQNNPTDNVAGAEPLAANLITKHPKLRAIFAYNDSSAIGAVQAISNNGKKVYSEDQAEGIVVVGFNAEEAGIQAIKEGKQYATFNLNPVKAGAALVEAAQQILSGQQVAKEQTVTADLITAENVNSFVSWNDEIKALSSAQ